MAGRVGIAAVMVAKGVRIGADRNGNNHRMQSRISKVAKGVRIGVDRNVFRSSRASPAEKSQRA